MLDKFATQSILRPLTLGRVVAESDMSERRVKIGLKEPRLPSKLSYWDRNLEKRLVSKHSTSCSSKSSPESKASLPSISHSHARAECLITNPFEKSRQHRASSRTHAKSSVLYRSDSLRRRYLDKEQLE